MEISKKMITDEQLCEKENEIVKTIADIVDGFKDQYAQIGYELNAQYTRLNDFDKGYTELTEESGEYVNGYSSKARIEILSPKTEKAAKAEEIPAEEVSADETAEASDSIESTPSDNTSEDGETVVSETVEEVEERAARTKAYTEIMIARVYKVFWTTKVSFTEDFSDLKKDLEEFLGELE